MQIILLKDVDHVGPEGAIVDVRPGHARNRLLPQQLARVADKKNRREWKHITDQAERRRKKAQAEAEAQRQQLQKLHLKIARKVGEQDKLFGSVTAQDIQSALKEKGIVVDRRKVELAEPIKSLGEAEVTVRVTTEVKAKVKVTVVAE